MLNLGTLAMHAELGYTGGGGGGEEEEKKKLLGEDSPAIRQSLEQLAKSTGHA